MRRQEEKIRKGSGRGSRKVSRIICDPNELIKGGLQQ